MIDQRIQHNYAYIKKITKHKLENTDEKDLQNQILFYETDIESCNCGNNKLESANFMIDIPCFHRLQLGAEFQECLKMSFDLNDNVEKLLITHMIKKIKKKDSKQKDDKCYEIVYAIQAIKHFSGYNNKDDIKDHVEKNISHDSDVFFIQNQGINLFNLIENGILIFKQIINQ